MSRTPTDLAVTGCAQAGHELETPAVAHIVRPKPELMARLLTLHQAVAQLAKSAPETLVYPEVARSLDQALVRHIRKTAGRCSSAFRGDGATRKFFGSASRPTRQSGRNLRGDRGI